MRRFRAVVAVLAAFGASCAFPSAHASHAARPHMVNSTFSILAYGYYCADGRPGCSTYETATCVQCPEAYQILAYAWGEPGQKSGRLSEVFAECDHYYTDTYGVRHDESEYAGYMAPTSGTGAISRDAESSTNSIGIVNFSTGVYAPSGDRMSVSGVQHADNSTDTNVSGGITVHLSGTYYDYGTTGTKSISCSTTLMAPHTALGTENEYEPFDPAHPYFYSD